MTESTTSSAPPPVVELASSGTTSPSQPAPAKAKSLRRTAFGSASWTAVGFGGAQIVRVFSSIILTRLIQPEVYGLMDLVTTCLIGLHLFSDVGLTPCIVQSPRGEDPKLIRTAWTIQVARGALLSVIAACIAWPMSVIYGRPILAWLLVAAGITAMVEGLNSPSVFILTRRIERARLVAFELITSIVTLGTTVGVVYLMRPGPFMEVMHGRLSALPLDESLVWAVVAGGMTGRLVYLLLSHVALPGARAQFGWDKSAVEEIFGFAKWIFFSTILAYLAMQTDRLLLPKFTNFETSGLYGRAIALLTTGTGVMGAFTSQVVFPLYSRLHQEGRPIQAFFSKIHLAVGVASALIVTGMITAGPSAARVLYPAAYDHVGWILQLLAVGGWFQMQQAAVGPVLLATGRRRAFVLPTVAKIIAMIVLVGPCWYIGDRIGLGGFMGMIIGFNLADFCMYAAVSWAAHRHGIEAWRSDIVLTLVIPVVALLAGQLANGFLGLVAPGDPMTRMAWLLRFFCQGTSVVAIWGVAGLILWRTGAIRLSTDTPAVATK